MNSLRAKLPEQILRVVAGWKKIPETYFRTLATAEVARVHREMSPADWLWQARENGNRRRQQGKTMGRLQALTTFKRQLGYRRAPLSCFFNPLRLPTFRLMRLTNSAVVSSRFSRLGLDRAMIACSLRLMARNECADG